MQEQDSNTRIENVMAVCKSCLSEFQNEKLTIKEKVFYFIVIVNPIMFLFSILLVVLGVERVSAQVTAVIVSVISLISFLIFCCFYLGATFIS